MATRDKVVDAPGAYDGALEATEFAAIGAGLGRPPSGPQAQASNEALIQQLGALQLSCSATSSIIQSMLSGNTDLASQPGAASLLPALLAVGQAAAPLAAAAAASAAANGGALGALGPAGSRSPTPPVTGARLREQHHSRHHTEKVQRTVYISDIHELVSEAQLALFFSKCGPLVDSRICGDPNSTMRFAFVEYRSEESAKEALSMSGCMLGTNPIRVSQSKTAIVPVNNQYLPRSVEERERVARTVYVANLDRGLEREVIRDFFESMCGPIERFRVLGDTQHTSKIAFLEFKAVESAREAIKCSGAILGGHQIRVSPSKTAVRVEIKTAGKEGDGWVPPVVTMAPRDLPKLSPTIFPAGSFQSYFQNGP